MNERLGVVTNPIGVSDKVRALKRIGEIRDKLLREPCSKNNVYSDGVLDFHNEVVKHIEKRI